MGAAAKVEPPIDIERFGALQADLAAGVPRRDALAEARLSDAQLVTATEHWLGEMGREVRRGRSALSQRYAKAYVARRPELLRDPDEANDALLLAAASPEAEAAPPAVTEAPAASPEGAPAVSRFVPSYMLEARPPAAAAAAPPAPPALAAPPSTARAPIPSALSDTAPVRSVRLPAVPFAAQPPSSTFGTGTMNEPPPVQPASVPAYVAPAGPQSLDDTAPVKPVRLPVMPFAASAPGVPPVPPAPASAAAPPTASPAKKVFKTMMAMDMPADFKAMPFSKGAAPSARAPAPSAPASQTAPPTSKAPESLPFDSSEKKDPLGGTMMALDVPTSFRAVPFSSPGSGVTPTSSQRAASPPSSGIHASTPVSAQQAGVPFPRSPSSTSIPVVPGARPQSSPSIPVVPPLPPLEQYVRMGIELAATQPAHVDAVLAQVRWSRAAWDHIDRSYRERIASDPALRQEFQAVVARERARRSGGAR